MSQTKTKPIIIFAVLVAAVVVIAAVVGGFVMLASEKDVQINDIKTQQMDVEPSKQSEDKETEEE